MSQCPLSPHYGAIYPRHDEDPRSLIDVLQLSRETESTNRPMETFTSINPNGPHPASRIQHPAFKDHDDRKIDHDGRTVIGLS